MLGSTEVQWVVILLFWLLLWSVWGGVCLFLQLDDCKDFEERKMIRTAMRELRKKKRGDDLYFCFLAHHSSLLLSLFSLYTEGRQHRKCISSDSLSSLLPFCWVLFLSFCSQRLGWDAHRRKWVGFLDCVCFCPTDPLLMPRALVKGQLSFIWL